MLPLIKIIPFDLKNASQAEYASLNQHINVIRRERLPDDPPTPLEETINELHNIPAFVDVVIWCAWDTGRYGIVGEAMTQLLRTEDNQHMAVFDITVQPDYRRQGLGRQLLALITETARADNRRLLIAQTYDRIPAGETFMDRLDSHRGLETHINQLRMADLDRHMLDNWIEQGLSHSAEFELGLWEGPYPEQQLTAVAALVELTNQSPHGDLEIEDMHMTPEQLRQSEQLIFAHGGQRWTFYITEKSTGKFVGYSETVWNPNRPEILSQDMTGVFPEFRHHGFGRWMKAAMLDKVLKERPQVKYVRTGNADSNAAMLKINRELGFKSYMANTLWQVDIDKVQAYLTETR